MNQLRKGTILKFPENFFWGASTSSHQVEGGNYNNWSRWEKANARRLARLAKYSWRKWQRKKFPEMLKPENYISGRACDHYHLYERDFDLAKSLSHNAHRFSLEWSRLEPEPGKFSQEAIEHYRRVILALRVRGLEPFVALWHWTNPLWLEKIGGVGSRKFPAYFSRYAKFVAENLGDIVGYWITLNEPTSVIGSSFMAGIWPPQKKSPLAALRVYKILAQAHNLAFIKIHESSSQARVGFDNILQFIESCNKNSMIDKLAVRIMKYFSNEKFLNLTGANHDFLTLHYYFHRRVKNFRVKNDNHQVSDLGWEIYPPGIYYLLKDLQKRRLPVYITENGLADAGDEKRAQFIRDHLYWIHRAIAEGVDVRGYFHWSLLDNFEWDKGFWPRFGLVEVDYKTMERKIRPSAEVYADICKNNRMVIR